MSAPTGHRAAVGEQIAFERADGRRIATVVGWYDNFQGQRTFVAEVASEAATYSSDGRWHVSEFAARPVSEGDDR